MEIAIVLGVAIFMALIFAFWATFIRKPQKGYLAGGTPDRSRQRKSRSKGSRAERTESHEAGADFEEESDKGEKRRRRKRKRPHRPRMPSLAEAGGLPPVKEVWIQSNDESNASESGGSQPS